MVRQIQFSSGRGVDSYPLSPMQQGMLFHCVQGGNPGVDVEQVVCELREDIVPSHLEEAWAEMIERHVVLRTGFQWAEGEEPRQVVQAAGAVRVPFYYEQFGSLAEARHGLWEFLQSDREAGFSRLDAPLFRVALLRAGPGLCWFVTTYHHLLLDARAMSAMFREVLNRHDALAQGRHLELPAPTAYRRYIDWLGTLDQIAAEKFWRQHLCGFATPASLPLAAPLAQERKGDLRGELAFRLHAPELSRLRRAAHQCGASINTMVQAAWAILLYRYTGEEDIVFGAVRACRRVPIPEPDAIIGLFINTIPVRARIGFQTTVADLLKALREQWQACRPFEHTPLMQIQRWSDVPAGRALFETFVSYAEPAWDASFQELGGAWRDRTFFRRSQPNYGLAIDASGGAELTVKLVYDRERFAGDAVARLLGHFRTLLESLAGDPTRKVSTLGMLTARERNQILVEWNQTSLPYDQHACVHSLVEQHAARAPRSLAISDPRTSLTYAELDRRANEVAHLLHAVGVGPETRVVVGMERSVEMIVAWLAVLKAGGAFVPLDPAYPPERIAFQLQDCGARVMLTQAGSKFVWPSLPNVDVIPITAEGDGAGTANAEKFPSSVTSRNLAYVIYTSGSTGQPKGVPIEHRSLMNLIAWHNSTYHVTPADRAMHVASPAFDASVWEIWPYLAAGASVHIPDEETRVSPAELVRWMASRGITIAFMPTPLAEAALTETWPQTMALRALLTGGDKLKRRPPAGVPCAVVNHYGPTENTVVSTFTPVAADPTAASAPAIGRPIANTRAYVLDREQQPVPVGVAGELYVGGDGLARGYLNRPELTAERFIADPFAAAMTGNAGASDGFLTPRDTARLYRTGDLVRWTATGDLEFIGRLDTQLKIRGCRIEPGEIEAAIHALPAVRESLVVAQADERGELQLAGYVVPREGASVEADAIVDALRAKLPAYMVPAAIVVLESWPLTPNGKIDRRALPPARLERKRASGALAGATEETVARIFAEVLGRTVTDGADNFFELGGHSLLAAQVISRLNAAVSASLSVRAVFDQPTVTGLAREVERRLENPTRAMPRVRRRVTASEMELVPPN